MVTFVALWPLIAAVGEIVKFYQSESSGRLSLTVTVNAVAAACVETRLNPQMVKDILHTCMVKGVWVKLPRVYKLVEHL